MSLSQQPTAHLPAHQPSWGTDALDAALPPPAVAYTLPLPRRNVPPIQDHWIYLPLKLRQTAPTELHIGVYLLYARQWGLTAPLPVPIHLTEQLICIFNGLPWTKLHRSRINRARHWLLKHGWLIHPDGARPRHYIPGWGKDDYGGPQPWDHQRPTLGKPRRRGYETMEVPVELIDLLMGTLNSETHTIERYWERPLLSLADLGHYVHGRATTILQHLGLIAPDGTYLPVPTRDTLLQRVLRGTLRHQATGEPSAPVQLSRPGLNVLHACFPDHLAADPHFVLTPPAFGPADYAQYQRQVAALITVLQATAQTAGRADIAVVTDPSQDGTRDSHAHNAVACDQATGLKTGLKTGSEFGSESGMAQAKGTGIDDLEKEGFRPSESAKNEPPAKASLAAWRMNQNPSHGDHPSMPRACGGERGNHTVLRKKTTREDLQAKVELLDSVGVKTSRKIAAATEVDIIKKCVDEGRRQQATGYVINDFGGWLVSFLRDVADLGWEAALAYRQPHTPAPTPSNHDVVSDESVRQGDGIQLPPAAAALLLQLETEAAAMRLDVAAQQMRLLPVPADATRQLRTYLHAQGVVPALLAAISVAWLDQTLTSAYMLLSVTSAAAETACATTLRGLIKDWLAESSGWAVYTPGDGRYPRQAVAIGICPAFDALPARGMGIEGDPSSLMPTLEPTASSVMGSVTGDVALPATLTDLLTAFRQALRRRAEQRQLRDLATIAGALLSVSVLREIAGDVCEIGAGQEPTEALWRPEAGDTVVLGIGASKVIGQLMEEHDMTLREELGSLVDRAPDVFALETRPRAVGRRPR